MGSSCHEVRRGEPVCDPFAQQAGAGVGNKESERSSDRADELFQQALREHHCGNLTTAQRLYSEILNHDPNHAGAWHALGLVDFAQRDLVSARKRIETALAICDARSSYWNSYGVLLKESGEYPAAEAALQHALELDRHCADAWSNLGHLQRLMRLPPQQAERSLRTALRLVPRHIAATFHLADLLQASGRHMDAIGQYRRGLHLAPDHPGAYKRLGEALISAELWEEAGESLDEASACDPGDPEIQTAIAFVHAQLERVDDARCAYRQVATMRGDRPIWKWKHLGICPTVFADDEAIEAYWARLQKELADCLDEPMELDWHSLPADGFTPPFNLPHHGRCCREVREMFAARFEPAFPRCAPQPSDSPLGRIGFLVTAGHEPGFLRGMARIIAGLDRRFEVVVFCAQRAVGRCQIAIRRNDVRYVTFSRRFDEAVDAVRSTRCDVIFFWKVGPDPWGYFLPMARLAPVQCTSAGCHGTSGVRAVDYYISSRLMESPDGAVDSRQHYTEGLFLLDTFPMLQSRQPSPKDVSRHEFGLPPRGALYLCPHRLPKYCPAFDFYLREILEQDRQGRVIVLGRTDARARELLQTRMRRNLGEARFRRVRFQPPMSVTEYYRLLHLATLVLDTPVYASSLTAYDAFSMGVPVLTQHGTLAVQCYAAGLYRRMGMETDLVTKDRDEYIASAVKIGTNPEYRDHLGRMLPERVAAVFDDQRVISEYERFFSSVIPQS